MEEESEKELRGVEEEKGQRECEKIGHRSLALRLEQCECAINRHTLLGLWTEGEEFIRGIRCCDMQQKLALVPPCQQRPLARALVPVYALLQP